MLRSFYIVCFICFSLAITGQDVVFTQFFENPIYLNPAFAGTDECPVVRVNSRNPALQSQYNTSSHHVSFNTYLSEINGGVAVSYLHDQRSFGLFKRNVLNISYSKLINLNKRWSVLAAISVGGGLDTYSEGKLVFSDMIDPYSGGTIQGVEQSVFENAIYPDLGTGFLFFDEDNYLGFSVAHMNNPKVEIANGFRIPVKFSLQGGRNFDLRSKYNSQPVILNPNFVMRYQNEDMQIALGLKLHSKSLTFGFQARTNQKMEYNFLGLIFGYEPEKYKLFYSYEMLVTNLQLNRTLVSAHEISFHYFLKCKKNKRVRAIKCPEF